MHTEQSHNARERTIIRSAFQALRPLLISETAFQASVSHVVRRMVRFTRARYTVAEREIVRRSEPAPRDSDEAVEPMITPRFDPWQAIPHELVSATRQLCVCSQCQGKRSKSCAVCAGSGRIYSWLAVEQRSRIEVRATPQAVAEHWLARALDEDDFLEEVWLHECEQDLVLPSRAMNGLNKELQLTLAQHDRVAQICLQSFAVDVHEVHYETAFGEGMVEVAGDPLTVFAAGRQPLLRRNAAARVLVMAAAVLAIGAPLLYRAQHPWFEKYGSAASALLLGLGASALLGTAFLGWLRANASRTVLSTWFPGAAALGLAALSSALLAGSKPSAAEARVALEQHDLERATLTADALYMLGAPRDEQRMLHDDIRLARMALTNRLADKLAIASSEGWTPQRKPAMEGAILAALQERAERARALHDGPSLVQLAALISPLLPREAHLLSLEAAAHESRTCMLKAEPRCIENSVQELDRLGAHELAAQSRRVLITLVRQRFDRAFEAISHSRSAKAELERFNTAQVLARKLEQLGAPLPSATQSLIERGIRRTEAQVLAASAATPAPAPNDALGPLATTAY